MANIYFTFSKADIIVKRSFTSDVLKGNFTQVNGTTKTCIPGTLEVLSTSLPSAVQLLILKSFKNLTAEEFVVANFIQMVRPETVPFYCRLLK